MSIKNSIENVEASMMEAKAQAQFIREFLEEAGDLIAYMEEAQMNKDREEAKAHYQDLMTLLKGQIERGTKRLDSALEKIENEIE